MGLAVFVRAHSADLTRHIDGKDLRLDAARALLDLDLADDAMGLCSMLLEKGAPRADAPFRTWRILADAYITRHDEDALKRLSAAFDSRYHEQLFTPAKAVGSAQAPHAELAQFARSTPETPEVPRCRRFSMKTEMFAEMANVERMLDFNMERHGVLASNLANAETPQYQPHDLVHEPTRAPVAHSRPPIAKHLGGVESKPRGGSAVVELEKSARRR